MHAVHHNEHETETVSWEMAVSSWVDGESEVRTEDLDTPYGRQVWDTYHMIGDVLRSEDLAIKPSSMFYARLSRAIDNEITVAHPRQRLSNHWRAGLSGLAVAAAVVTVVWVAVPYFGTTPAKQAPSTTIQMASVQSEPAHDVDPALNDYFDAHEGLTGVVPIHQVSYGGVQP